jgi:hypothetical protein
VEDLGVSQSDEGCTSPKTHAKHEWFAEGQAVVIQLSPEYNAKVPLFPLSDDTNGLVPKPLLGRLMAWQKDFNSSFDWDTGWRSDEAKTKWAAEAIPLEAELRQALEGKADLVVDLWPLNNN